MTKVELYAIGQSTTLESNKSLGFLLQTEGNLSRVNDILYAARERIEDEVAYGETGARSVRRPPARYDHVVALHLEACIVE
jgi:hypothetical protein